MLIVAFLAGVFVENIVNKPIVSAPIYQEVQIVVTPTPSQITVDSVEESTNKWRESNGEKPLKHLDLLCGLANARVEEIKTDWSHDGLDKRKPILRSYINYSKFGENLAKDFKTPKEIINSWDLSPGHRENLSDPTYTHTCVATDGNYVVQIYAAF